MRFVCVCITVILPQIRYNLACGNLSKEINMKQNIKNYYNYVCQL